MSLPTTFARLGGARDDVLEIVPYERARFVATAWVLISTALLSGVSCAFALVMALSVPVAVAVTAGLLWALVILNLDRLLVVGMSRQSSIRRAIGMALPRLVLALIIGTVISTPLTLQLFDAEIQQELGQMRTEADDAAARQLAESAQYREIETLDAAIAVDREIVARGTAADPSTPSLLAAATATTAAQTAFDEAEAAYLGEFDGTGGTGRVGDGPITQSKRVARDEALNRLNDAKGTEAALRTTIERESADEVERAEERLITNTAQRDELLRDRADELAQREEANANPGLLARLDALHRISVENAVLSFAHFMIAALFVCLELLPVIFKLLQGLGKPTVYDEVAELRDRGSVEAGRVWADKQLAAISQEADVQVELARHRSALQVESGKQINAVVIAQQEEVVTHALEAWQRHASARAAEKIKRWEEEADVEEFATLTTRGMTAQSLSYQQLRKHGFPDPSMFSPSPRSFKEPTP